MIQAIDCTAKSGGGETSGAAPAMIPSAPGQLRVNAFIDTANMRYALRELGHCRPDYGGLVDTAVREFGRRLLATKSLQHSPQTGIKALGEIEPAVVCSGAWCLMCCPTDVHPDDAEDVKRREGFYYMLQRKYGFTPIRVPISFRGYHLSKEDRRASGNEAERRWEPKERGADVALGCVMALRAAAADRPDGIICLTGDIDLAPAVQIVLKICPSMPTMVAGFSSRLSSAYWNGGPEGYHWPFQPIVLDRLVAAPAFEQRRTGQNGRH